MGYTHYWRVSGSLDKDKFKEFSSDCKKIAEMSDVGLANLQGEEKTFPEFSETEVSFNGIGKYSCESFFVNLNTSGFNFCKTRRRPYDTVVVACLLCLKYYFDDVSVSSDGDNEEWSYGTNLYKSIFPNRD